ncbi:MAG: TonB-dependent receptor [Bacteroidales bacterium]|jgi:TonB-linked SusC/RagA family outer membrane protein|nr:TonB-dependent receptor [Bacteroidales bacterium]MDD2264966.1 TonB-dependent receptor [Bacteroidales bacterium]MDD2832134.1 TonB-dependent receptor [Bacteroidales bacterium]MDD3208786.1 TonB-dependent receptor [Bacteroidales bacterium]MDD3697349.1 TonB-dependent receptor [Bacteroidales bacterium]
MKKTLFLVLAVLVSISAIAQQRITGKVTSSEDGSPLPFVTILIQGERGLGTNTDIDGNFVIERCPNNAVLVLSYVGYTTIQVPVAGRNVVNVTMIPDAFALEEVMVVAYGTARKGTYTGAASVVKSEAIKDVPALSFENALNGKVAGMQITTNSGQAGAVSSIRVRGIGSMNASNEPLYVIDGVPVVSGDTGQMSGYIYATNNVMSTLNPQDIESITVLKDAAASALYGSRAANGVILVTTKTGRLGRPVVNFKTSVGITPSFATVNFDIASPEEQVELYYENFWNAGKYDGKTDEASSKSALAQLNKRFNKHGYRFTADDNTVNSLKILGMTDGIENREGKYYNWDDVLFRTAIYQTYDLSVSGANERTSYYSSLSYTKEQGRSTVNDFSRIAGRVNVNQKVGKIIEFTTNVNIAKNVQHGFNDTRSTGANYFMQSRNLLWPLYWPTDYKTGAPWTARYGSYAYNQVYYNNEWENESNVLRLSANETLTVKFMPELVLKSVLSFDNTQTRDHIYYSANHFSASSVKGQVHEMFTNFQKIVSSTTLNYDKEFADKHMLNLLVGWEAEENKTDFQRSSGTNLPTSALHTVATAGVLDANAYYWGNTMLSLLSRAEYSYDGRYYLSGSFRRDGSSRLGSNTRWGNFWSVAGSWRINNEGFMKDITQISNLRLRGSYGVNGTLPSSNYGWRALTSYGNKYMEDPGGGVANIADANLSWETSYTWNAALEFGLFNNRLNGTIEYFNRDSKDLLQSVPISTVTGFSSTLRNIGEINNHGLEIELSGDIIRTGDLRWSAGLTGSWIRSTVTKLYDSKDIRWYDPTGGDARAKFIYREGESTLALYGLEWAGVEDATGRNVWFLNNDSQPDLTVDGRPATYNYSKADEVILGDAHPDFFGGFVTDLSWKGLSIALNFVYKIGGYTYNAVGRDVNDDGYYWERIMSKYCYDNRWTPSNKTAKYPQRIAIDMEDVNQKSSRHMNPADYLRLKNVSVAYNLPRAWTNKISIQNARIFFNGTNLWTLAAHKEYDPEVNEYGSRGWEIPLGKTFTFGLEFSF